MPVSKPSSEMSAFERRRLENMAANRKIINEISTTTVKMATPKPAAPKRAATTSRPKREPVKREPLRPTRQSSRLAGLDAESEVLKRKLEVEAESQNERAREKRLRVSGDLTLGDIKVEGRKWEGGAGGMAGLKSLGIPARGAQPGVRTFTDEDIEETEDGALKELRLRMNGLKMYEKWAVNGEWKTSP